MKAGHAVGLIALFGLAILIGLLWPSESPEPDLLVRPTVAGGGGNPVVTEPSTSLPPLREIPVTNITPPAGLPDPIEGLDPLPDGYLDILPRDAILPVYNPTFRSVAETDWPADALVIGIVIDGDARAYPVSFLSGREMVIDWIGGTPVLVSW